jgi:hypothetical protein
VHVAPDATLRTLVVRASGPGVAHCQVQVSPEWARQAQGSLGASAAQAIPAHAGFLETCLRTDLELLPLQHLLVKTLAREATEDATRILITLAGDSNAMARFGSLLRESLRGVRGKEALSTFWETGGPWSPHVPLGPLAEASFGALVPVPPAIVSRIAGVLSEPSSSELETTEIAPLVAKHATAREQPVLHQYFGRNRTRSDSDPLTKALLSVSDALFRLRNMGDFIMLRSASEDSTTNPTLRAYLTDVLATMSPAPPNRSGIGPGPKH